MSKIFALLIVTCTWCGLTHIAAAQPLTNPMAVEAEQPKLAPVPPPTPIKPPPPTVGVRTAPGATGAAVPPPNRPEGPFATTERMELESQRYAPAAGPSAIPLMSLRGFADDGKSPPLAAIEVDGGLYYIRQGESSNIVTRGGRALTLTLDKLVNSAAAVHLEGMTDSILIR